MDRLDDQWADIIDSGLHEAGSDLGAPGFKVGKIFCFLRSYEIIDNSKDFVQSNVIGFNKDSIHLINRMLGRWYVN